MDIEFDLFIRALLSPAADSLIINFVIGHTCAPFLTTLNRDFVHLHGWQPSNLLQHQPVRHRRSGAPSSGDSSVWVFPRCCRLDQPSANAAFPTRFRARKPDRSVCPSAWI